MGPAPGGLSPAERVRIPPPDGLASHLPDGLYRPLTILPVKFHAKLLPHSILGHTESLYRSRIQLVGQWDVRQLRIVTPVNRPQQYPQHSIGTTPTVQGTVVIRRHAMGGVRQRLD